MTEAAQINATNAASYLLERESEFLLRSRMLSLRSLTEFMANMRGRRKSIIYVTTGLGASVYEALDYDGGIRSIAIEDLHAAITAATRGNVSIYPMDPAGSCPARRDRIAAANPDNTVPEPSGTTLGRMQDLRALAETTGGFAIVNTNSFNDGFTRVVRENSSYYILGFSTTPQTDGRFHSVEIRVKRPGLQVRSRGYLAPLRRKTPSITRASTLAPAIVDALQSPIGVAGVPIRLFAAPYKGSDQQAKVAIAAEFGVEALNLTERSGRLPARSPSRCGRRPPKESFSKASVTRHWRSSPEDIRGHQEAGRRVVTEMSLPPGRYQLRVAGGPTVGTAGSVTYDLDIPSFTKEPLAMSGVALTSSTAEKPLPCGRARRGHWTRLPSPITVAREFWPEEIVTLYAEVYENGRRPAHYRLPGRSQFGDRTRDVHLHGAAAVDERQRRHLQLHCTIRLEASIPAHMCSAWRQRQPQARRRRSHGNSDQSAITKLRGFRLKAEATFPLVTRLRRQPAVVNRSTPIEKW